MDWRRLPEEALERIDEFTGAVAVDRAREAAARAVAERARKRVEALQKRERRLEWETMAKSYPGGVAPKADRTKPLSWMVKRYIDRVRQDLREAEFRYREALQLARRAGGAQEEQSREGRSNLVARWSVRRQ